MAEMEKIKKQIRGIVQSKPEYWYVGVCTDPVDTKQKGGFPRYWRHWQTDTLEDARKVEKHFRQMGCLKCVRTLEDRTVQADEFYVYLY